MKKRETWLVTGGAGYIGSHVAALLLENNFEIVILDSFVNGLESRLSYLEEKFQRKLPLIRADIRDFQTLESMLGKYKPDGVLHLAALKSVADSIENENEYLDVNQIGTRNIVNVSNNLGIKKIIFSSTAAVYESLTGSELMSENQNLKPISPYGISKMLAEIELEKFLNVAGNNGTALRFFNVVGSSCPELADSSTENLVPKVMNKIAIGEPPIVFGADYPTNDGTCIRDYVDVRDIARAHLSVIHNLESVPAALNIGTGKGISVLETIQMILGCLKKESLGIEIGARRDGDPAFACADVSLMRSVTGFESKYTLKESILSLINK